MASRRNHGKPRDLRAVGTAVFLAAVLPVVLLPVVLASTSIAFLSIWQPYRGVELSSSGSLSSGSLSSGSLLAALAGGVPADAALADLIFVVSGPNDGEPINGRTIRLRLRTNYSKPGILRVHVDGVYAFSRSLDAASAVDDSPGTDDASQTTDSGHEATSGTATQEIRLDLASIERLRGRPLGGTDSTLRVTVYLYDAYTLRLRTYDEWTGRLPRPRMELLTTELAANGMQGLGGFVTPAGKVPVIAYPLKEDTYLFVFASTQRSVLDLSPENPAVYRQARILLAGNTSRVIGGPSVNRSVVFVDQAWSQDGSPIHVALWTYDSLGGWKRSPVLAIATRP